jgi:hypothetical protein
MLVYFMLFGMVNCHLLYFMAILYFLVIWYYFSPFWYIVGTEKNLATRLRTLTSEFVICASRFRENEKKMFCSFFIIFHLSVYLNETPAHSVLSPLTFQV